MTRLSRLLAAALLTLTPLGCNPGGGGGGPSGSVAPTITSSAPSSATVGAPYGWLVTATGSPTPTIGASNLPAWLALSGDTLSGTPGPGDVGVTATITVSATNPAGAHNYHFQITVDPRPVGVFDTHTFNAAEFQ